MLQPTLYPPSTSVACSTTFTRARWTDARIAGAGLYLRALCDALRWFGLPQFARRPVDFRLKAEATALWNDALHWLPPEPFRTCDAPG